MKLSNALRNMAQLQTLTIFTMIVNGIMAIGLAYALLVVSNQRERLVIIPPSLEARAIVAWDGANVEYLKSFGLYIATMVANLQPKTASVVIEAVSGFFEPQIYAEFRQQALTIVDDPVLRQSGTVISFQPASVAYEKETRRVFVTGQLITKGNNVERQKSVTYEVGVVMKEGRPWVEHFTSYEGGTLRTVMWHMNAAKGDVSNVPQHAVPKTAQNLQGNGEADAQIVK